MMGAAVHDKGRRLSGSEFDLVHSAWVNCVGEAFGEKKL